MAFDSKTLDGQCPTAHSHHLRFVEFARSELPTIRAAGGFNPQMRSPVPSPTAQEESAMSLAEKITALLEGFTRYQIEGLTPIARRQLANACQRVLTDCNRVEGPPKPKAGDATVERTVDATQETAEPTGVLEQLKVERAP
jgi:hypothetical protein